MIGRPQRDARKSEASLKKHGVAFDEALTVFGDPLARIFDDLDYSAEEPREIIIGYSAKARLLVVGFTERSGRVRLIHGVRDRFKAAKQDYDEHHRKREQ